MAAPPGLTAAQVRAQMAAKTAAYNETLRSFSVPLVQTLMDGLKRALQNALEDDRPTDHVVAKVDLHALPSETIAALVADRIQTAVTTQVTARGFQVGFENAGGFLSATLTWAP